MAIKKTNQDLLTKIFKIVDENYAKVADAGDVNVIEAITVNGTAVEVADKTVALTVPTETEIQTIAAEQVAASGHASLEVVTELPDADSAESNILYLYKNETTGYYDIYALIGGEVLLLDDTSIDLSGYATTEAVATAIEESGHLSESDFEEFTDDEVAEAYAAAIAE